jgi:hypothetical protein
MFAAYSRFVASWPPCVNGGMFVGWLSGTFLAGLRTEHPHSTMNWTDAICIWLLLAITCFATIYLAMLVANKFTAFPAAIPILFGILLVSFFTLIVANFVTIAGFIPYAGIVIGFVAGRFGCLLCRRDHRPRNTDATAVQ